MAMKAVAGGTAVDVNASSCGEIRGVGLHVRADHFALNTRIERHVDQLSLMGEGWIVDCNGYPAVHEVHDGGEWDQNEPDDQAENEAHKVLSRPPQESIVEHGGTVSGKKEWRASK